MFCNSVVDIVVKVVTYLKPELTQPGGATPRGGGDQDETDPV